ncbi:tRNA lysidine(34) synthetase TilS [Sulfurospirillum barnesii]|uniref:tRNA(Ile)-lysidine synthase n=1 Tax=Sulfurospirillum barnesii (strain ATCC 700032 / DSM 10660 / SES-3) TaxID=760154 RepID=I3XV23_SULBS|nr:tRNA lysidine(34) synthetase TilS [Sulfurospirillum barnesii]AFL67797.1 tRNA(Ile)-lysidine synthetase [Sulfurospirillum barnesii SES-3]
MQPLPLLHEATLSSLKRTKNLLAFSGGGDSTALFFLLHVNAISFDIAHVNYQTRKQSDAEEAYAKTLANTYGKSCFSVTCKLENANFEHRAREERYAFFESLMQEHGYETLIMAHHLGDRLEWLLMQLCKGAGVVEMLGMQEREEREGYAIVRPLLHVNKPALKNYLEKEAIAYFEDESNASLRHQRNAFRHHFANPLLEKYEKGILQSFHYLAEDAKRLVPHQAKRIKDLFILPQDSDDLINIRQIDKILKILGVLASTQQRREILQTRNCVIAHRIAVVFDETLIYIAPYVRLPMMKKDKEVYRKAKIPAKIRGYLALEKIDATALLSH